MSPIIGAKRSLANFRGQEAVKIGRMSISLATLTDDSFLPARCRARISTAVSIARDVKRMPFIVSAISGRQRIKVSRTENSIRSGCKLEMTALAANIASCTVSSLDVLVFRKLVRSIGQIAARRTNAAAHPLRRILFCSSRSSIENSRCCRAARTVAKNIRAAISYRIVSPVERILGDRGGE